MLTKADRELLAWALDGLITERHGIGFFKLGAVKAAAERAKQDPELRARIIAVVEYLDPKTATSIAEFFKHHTHV